MARAHFRILAALFALAVLTVTVLGAIWMYRENIAPEQKRKDEVAALMKTPGPRVDPGHKVYEQAVDLIRRGEMEAARQKLTEVIEVYRDSDSTGSARELLGEMNMDRLFERAPMPGKLEYTVTRADSLNALAGKFQTTIAYIKRVNNLLGSVIHPGDRLVIYPLNFEVEVDLTEKRLTLIKDGRYFKDYRIVSHHLPVTQLSRETTVADSSGYLQDKKLRPDHESYPGSQKRLQTAGKGSRSGIIFCPEPPKPPEGQPPSSQGIYLGTADMNELSTIIRPGTPLRFLKAKS